jgi:hypothetical protein
MTQLLLAPLVCAKCGNEYYETGYWHDGEYCPACSIEARFAEEERRKGLARMAAEIAERRGLDLGALPDDLPEDIRKELNPRNAGRREVKYESAYCELLVDQAAEGKTEAEFAAGIGVAQSLLQYWTEKHPRFRKAREIAGEQREAWIEKHYRLAMLRRIECNPSMMIRYGAAKLGWGDRSETALVGNGGEIPVVRIVERDADFPQETLKPTADQIADMEAGE